MDMLEFLRTRRTYRRFEQRPVAPEILTEAVDAARIASCGANRQTVRYIVVQSADAVAAVQPLVHLSLIHISEPTRRVPSSRMPSSA